MASFFGMAGSGVPTIGTLEHHILIDQRMADWQKQQLLAKLNAEIGHLPKSTPLVSIIGSLGGGLIGWLVAKYFSMGPVGQIISTAAGFGLGSQLQGAYNALGELASGDRSSMVTPYL
jgi:hypothetical protein